MAITITTHLLARAFLLLFLIPFSCSVAVPSIETTGKALSSRELSKRALQATPLNLQTDGTYPRAVKLSKDGSILVGYAHPDGSSRRLSILRSTDNGGSFNPYSTITFATNRDLDNIFLYEVPGSSGPTVLAAFRNHDQNADGVDIYFRITVCQSLDGGKAWAFLSQAAEKDGADGLGLWEPFMRTGADGSIQLTYSQEVAGNDQQTFRTISKDGGKTWSAGVNLHVHAADQHRRDGMQGIVQVTDGGNGKKALVMVFETTPWDQTGPFHVEYAVSYDDGATYGAPAVVYQTSKSGFNAGSPQIATLGDGFVVVFMTDEDQTSTNWPVQASVKAILGAKLNNGKITWDAASRHTVEDSPSHWPGVLGIGSEVWTMYDHSALVEGKVLSLAS